MKLISDETGFFWDDYVPPKAVKEKVVRIAPIITDYYHADVDLSMLCEFEKLPENQTLMMDIETYPNFYVVSFLNEQDQYLVFCSDEITDLKILEHVALHNTLVTFNGTTFDVPILGHILWGAKTESVYEAAKWIINRQRYERSDFAKKFKQRRIKLNHIDLINLMPLKGSLKLCAARIGAKSIFELPFHEDEEIAEEDKENLIRYNLHDLLITRMLYSEVTPQLELRRHLGQQYDMDLRSKSDPGIAEAIIVRRREPSSIPDSIEYIAPDYLRFRTPLLRNVLEKLNGRRFDIESETGKVIKDKDIPFTVKVNDTEYQVGVGGLHSRESNMIFGKALSYDVTAYYPSIVLGNSYYPQGQGREFLSIYENIVRTRNAAKANKDKIVSDSLKIVINGTYGKFGNMYSGLYDPRLITAVTLTGQLSLLMLIEMLELAGIPVMSANTDGIVCAHDAKADRVIETWEKITKYRMERTELELGYCDDVNNYVWLQTDGKLKLKGRYDYKPALKKNPDRPIIYRAAVDQLVYSRKIENTILDNDNVAEFVTVRTVNGGAVLCEGESNLFIGKVCRWIHAKRDNQLVYVKSGNNVPNGNNVYLQQTFTEDWRQEVDRDYYIELANKIIEKFN